MSPRSHAPQWFAQLLSGYSAWHDLTSGHLQPEELRDHVSEGLAPKDSARVARHLSECRQCRASARFLCLEAGKPDRPASSVEADLRKILKRGFVDERTNDERLWSASAWAASNCAALGLREAVKRGADGVGLAMLTNALMTELEESAGSSQRVLGGGWLDQEWPILETIEPMVPWAILFPESRAELIRLYARLSANSVEDSLRVVLAWGINEPLERGDASRDFAVDALKKLLEEDHSDATRTTLAVVHRLRAKEVADRLPPKVARELQEAYTYSEKEIGEWILDFDTWLPKTLKAAGTPSQVVSELRRSGIDAVLEALCSGNDNVAPDPVRAVVAHGALKQQLKALTIACRTGAPAQYDSVVRELCVQLFDWLPEDANAINLIEPCEAIRDAYPKICAEVMGEMVDCVPARLAHAFFLCTWEGKEGKYRGVFRKHVASFAEGRMVERWRYRPAVDDDDNLDEFGRRAERKIHGAHHLEVSARWMNERAKSSLRV